MKRKVRLVSRCAMSSMYEVDQVRDREWVEIIPGLYCDGWGLILSRFRLEYQRYS
jgi:hypothetical protein